MMTEFTEFIIVLITAQKEEEAAEIAKDIVGKKLAACVNIVRGVRSIYRWRGKTEDEEEVLMVVKSRRTLFPDLMKRVKELHRYTVPEIIALPIIEGSEEYLGWLKEETG
ncbi:MAG: divalent-cation tolerance protein CutA [Nitrospiraceae bacterium]|nr:divalent-cation tolerance protein CutA [Nitrospiraceae bacterium]